VWIGFDQPKTIIANGYGGELAVPIWATFMKAATRGDKRDWFERPPEVVGANVCRVSGKLANSGCGAVISISNDGFLQSRSQIYTEYFVKATAPTAYCPIHTAAYGAVATTGQMPAVPAPSGAPPPAVQPTQAEQPKAEPEPKEKRRGFWSRLFGRDKAPKKPGG
jgi:membrane peptidoglycan carboxypeptidase